MRGIKSIDNDGDKVISILSPRAKIVKVVLGVMLENE